LEPEAVQIEMEASLLVPDENRHRIKAEIEVLAIGLKAAAVRPMAEAMVLCVLSAIRKGAHASHYTN
jgi:hypothetical protein